MENVILNCQNLYKHFGKKEILKGISFEICSGDILGFIGPNGSGKTTTIKLILGLQSIDNGSVEINGFNVVKNFEKAIEKVGAIVENPDLYMYLSGYENLKLIANLYKNVSKSRIDEVVKLVGLENRIKDKVSKYSLGMRQRLGIAQAILHKPNLLILDEPTNGLDPEGIKDMRELLINLATKEHMGILISSHNLAELENFCNKVCIIKNGEVVETNSISDVKKEVSKGYFIFEIDNVKEAIILIGEDVTTIDDKRIKVAITKEQVPDLVRKLVMQNIKIYSVVEETLTLEDAFLEKTGGNIID